MSRILFAAPLLLAAVLLAGEAQAQARNAAFTNPNAGMATSGSSGKNGGAVTVVADPATIDAGETLVNVARRVTVFFFNGFRAPVQIQELTLNADGNVRSKVITDDCKTLKSLPVSDRCSIAIEITPSSPGPWSVELLLNHSGQGRIARAEVTGTTLGKADEKSEGLAISKKIAAPLDFGSVKAVSERAARTMLIENDSAEKLLISKIDLISDDENLSLRDVGCKEGDELKPGESCPVTVMWAPQQAGTISTDLLINHNGNLGYVVVPIRGKAEGEEGVAENGSAAPSSSAKPKRGSTSAKAETAKTDPQTAAKPSAGQLESLPLNKNEPAPSASDVAKSIPPLKADVLSPLPRTASPSSVSSAPRKETVKKAEGEKEAASEKLPAVELPPLSLIGTIGNRAIMGDEEGQTHMLSLGETADIGGVDVELVQLEPSRAVVRMAGQRKELRLRTVRNVIKNRDVSGGDVTGASGADAKSAKPDSAAAGKAPAINSNTSGAGDGSAPASVSPSAAPAAGGGAASSTPAVLPTGKLNAQDVLNMLN